MLVREILHLLLSTAAGLLGSALLLRAYLGWLRISRSNPLAVFCVALTQWLVSPLRRLLPLRGRWDGASLLAATLIAAAFVFLVGLLFPRGGLQAIFFLPAVLLLLLHWVLYLVMVLVLANALISLINPHAPLAPTFDILTRPMLAPLRRFIPAVGGFDLSTLVLIVLVQVALLVIDQAGF